jgi:hypothetical protein
VCLSSLCTTLEVSIIISLRQIEDLKLRRAEEKLNGRNNGGILSFS